MHSHTHTHIHTHTHTQVSIRVQKSSSNSGTTLQDWMVEHGLEAPRTRTHLNAAHAPGGKELFQQDIDRAA